MPRLSLVLALSASLTLGASSLAFADQTDAVTFFSGGGGTAAWAEVTPGDTDSWSIKLTLPANSPTSFAGATLTGAPTALPAAAPSFDFMSTVSGDSGGSPRLVIRFSNGGKAELRPLTLTAGTWTTVNGTLANWDINGGTGGACASFLYAQDYAKVQSCFPTETVTSVFVVTDSAWKHAAGYTHWIDNIRFGNTFITRPGNGDGDEDEADGDNHNGNHHDGQHHGHHD
jgi:hypothetical protein